ncbi:ATP-dependent Clp protease, proteolytic subunit [Handroanthus impetiginosus]|uniref:ATP-dependent Clp protease proteolytic subunit n=1 Tax=Handroanthus impetiginosus TaxID=429701 RepID=A0A2G9HQF3_9LAMI|nr:ATP-dependent Clp protease, proteolytic subunit [Handroanthus impetiginosus]
MAASSLLLSSLSSAAATKNHELSFNSTASAFLRNPKLLFAAKYPKSAVRRCVFKSPVARKSLDHIPEQFREENLEDGLMDNFENAPQHLYGLTPGQIELLMTTDNPLSQQGAEVTEETITARYSYMNNGGMYSLSGMSDHELQSSLSASMYRGGARGGYGRPRSAPPDLPSLLLDARIVYLGMPIVPPVTELIIAELMWLEYDDNTKPIYVYINSPGTQDEGEEIVGSESDAYAIADALAYCKSPIYTINLGMAFGQAAMLLSLGVKGKRGTLPNASTKLYLPSAFEAYGASTDMWIMAKELDSNVETYIEFVAKGTGKTKEEIAKDIALPKYFEPEDAIDYGLVDTILVSEDLSVQKQHHDEMLAQAKARRALRGGSLQESLSQQSPRGFR